MTQYQRPYLLKWMECKRKQAIVHAFEDIAPFFTIILFDSSVVPQRPWSVAYVSGNTFVVLKLYRTEIQARRGYEGIRRNLVVKMATDALNLPVRRAAEPPR